MGGADHLRHGLQREGDEGERGPMSPLSLMCLAGYAISAWIILAATGADELWGSFAANLGAVTVGFGCIIMDGPKSPQQ